MRKTCILAEMPGFGRVYDCGECGGIHVTVGPVSVTLTPEAYMQLVAMIHTSAANFETWLARNRAQPGLPENTYADSDGDGVR